MRTLKNSALAIAGLIAWMMIGISGDMLQTKNPLVTSDYIYALLLVLSVAYLHWALRMYLIPIKQLPPKQAKELQDATYAKYAKGFLAGTIGAGYVLLALHILALLDRHVSHRPSFLSLALFLIALGTVAQTRAVVENLCNVLVKNEEK